MLIKPPFPTGVRGTPVGKSGKGAGGKRLCGKSPVCSGVQPPRFPLASEGRRWETRCERKASFPTGKTAAPNMFGDEAAGGEFVKTGLFPLVSEGRRWEVCQNRPFPTSVRGAPVGSSRPVPVGSSRPAPVGSSRPAPVGSSCPAPVGSSSPAPAGSSSPVPLPQASVTAQLTKTSCRSILLDQSLTAGLTRTTCQDALHCQ